MADNVQYLRELDFPDDLKPYVKLQELISELNNENYTHSCEEVIQLLLIINFHDICSNAFSIADRRPKEMLIIAKLLTEVCHFTKKRIELRASENPILMRMFEVLDREDVLTPGAKHNYHKEVKKVGNQNSEIQRIIQADDMEALIEYITLHRIDITKSTIIYYFDCYNDPEMINQMKYQSISFLNYSALYGAEKCFKYFILEGLGFDKDTPRFAVIGGSLEIIRLCAQHKCNFGNEVFTAICHFRNEIFDWILLNYQTKQVQFDLLCCTSNIAAVYYYMSKHIIKGVAEKHLIYSIKSNSSALIRVCKHFKCLYLPPTIFKDALMSASLEVVNLLYHPDFIKRIGASLIDIASKNSKSVVKFALKHKSRNIAYPLGNALLESAIRDDIDMANFLFKHGASFGEVFVNILSSVRSIEMYNLLLSHNVPIANYNQEVLTNLISGQNQIRPNEDFLLKLFHHGACIDCTIFAFESSLLFAIRNCTEENNWVPLLLKYGVDLLYTDHRGQHALHYACEYDKPEVIDMLVKAGANPNKPDDFGGIPMFLAKSPAVIEAMMRNGATADFTVSGEPFIVILYITYKFDLIDTCVKCGCNPNVEINNEPLFIVAARERNYDVSYNLYKSDKIDTHGEILALIALDRERLAEVDIDHFLLHFNSNPQHFAKVTDKRGNTALHYLLRSSWRNEKLQNAIKILLENGADVNVQNNEGVTPAMLAVSALNAYTDLFMDKINTLILDNKGRNVIKYHEMCDLNHVLNTMGDVDTKPNQHAPSISGARTDLHPIVNTASSNIYSQVKAIFIFIFLFVFSIIFGKKMLKLLIKRN